MVAVGEHRGEWDEPEAVLRVTVAERDGWTIVSLSGDLDLDEAATARCALDDALARAPRGVVADLSGLTFLGSSGARTLLEAATAARETGRVMRVVQGSGPARRLLEMLGLGDRIDLVDRG